MLYWMPNLMFPDAFMSAIAAVRDQTTLQLIATSTLQHDLQAGMEKTLEASATAMEDYADRFARSNQKLLTRHPRVLVAHFICEDDVEMCPY